MVVQLVGKLMAQLNAAAWSQALALAWHAICCSSSSILLACITIQASMGCSVSTGAFLTAIGLCQPAAPNTRLVTMDLVTAKACRALYNMTHPQLLLVSVPHALQHIRRKQRVQHLWGAAAGGYSEGPCSPGLLGFSLLLPQAVQLLLHLHSEAL